jgi:hypothetical protein
MAKQSKEPIRTEDIFDATDNRPADAKKSSKCQDVEAWLQQCYVFRFNVIKQKPEWKKADKPKDKFIPLDDYTLLSMKRELDAAGYTISSAGLKEILCSSFSPAVNPVKQYFRDLFPWDEVTDHIAELANTVTCKNSEDWHTYFKKWLVAVVANVFIDEQCANHTMLVLSGDQGKYKTTWLEQLCPKELKPYMYTGKIDPTNKDSLTLIAEMLFVNIDDQLMQLNKKDENELKNLITINQIKYRRAYTKFVDEYPHLCSFMASVNGTEFLTDPTGSRRFLPFEVKDIDIEAAKKINMDLVFAQAYQLFTSGFRYWFISTEVDRLNKKNEQFAMISIEEDVLKHYFRPEKSDKYKLSQYCELTPGMLLVDLEIATRQRLNKKKLGQALNKLGFKDKQKTIDGKVQHVRELWRRDPDEIELNKSSVQPPGEPTEKIKEASKPIQGEIGF